MVEGPQDESPPWTKLLEVTPAAPIIVKVEEPQDPPATNGQPPGAPRRQSLLGSFHRQLRLSFKGDSSGNGGGPLFR